MANSENITTSRRILCRRAAKYRPELFNKLLFRGRQLSPVAAIDKWFRFGFLLKFGYDFLDLALQVFASLGQTSRLAPLPISVYHQRLASFWRLSSGGIV